MPIACSTGALDSVNAPNAQSVVPPTTASVRSGTATLQRRDWLALARKSA